MSYKKIHRRTKKRKRIGFQFCVPLRNYASDNFLSESGVRYRIASYKLIAYWFKRKWWVLPPEYYEQLGVYPKGAEQLKKPSQNNKEGATFGAG